MKYNKIYRFVMILLLYISFLFTIILYVYNIYKQKAINNQKHYTMHKYIDNLYIQLKDNFDIYYKSYNFCNCNLGMVLLIDNICYSYYENQLRDRVIDLKHNALNITIDKMLRMNDPFSSTKLKYVPGIIYSIGPDAEDNQALIEYDPTNGIVSKGDIILFKSKGDRIH